MVGTVDENKERELLDALSALDRTGSGARLVDLAARLGTAKGAMHRRLQVAISSGRVLQDASTQRYRVNRAYEPQVVLDVVSNVAAAFRIPAGDQRRDKITRAVRLGLAGQPWTS